MKTWNAPEYVYTRNGGLFRATDSASPCPVTGDPGYVEYTPVNKRANEPEAWAELHNVLKLSREVDTE